VAEWTPERTAETCGITVDEVVDLARLYGGMAKAGEPVAIRTNYGVQRVHGGGMAVRNIACLPALVGAWRHAAGGVQLSSSGSFPTNKPALQRPDLLKKQPRTINMTTIGDDLLRPASPEFGPQVEAVIVYNSNPLAIAPDSDKVMRGFLREDLFTVVLEHFQTDTADYADIVLPATTQLEHIDAHTAYGHLYMMANNAAIAPMGEAKPNTEIFRLLAARMGFDDDCFKDSDDELAARPSTRTCAPSVSTGTPEAEGLAETEHAGCAVRAGGFPTPSGKCEFYSAQMEADGLDPLPAYIAPYESVASNPELAKRYPLAMISPPARNFLNSTFVNVKSLRSAEGEPHLDIHPDDSAARGIADGDMVRIFNDRGSFIAKARVTDKARAAWWWACRCGGRSWRKMAKTPMRLPANS
jgi:anaerobic selenocysteine-containing dehydrogenase